MFFGLWKIIINPNYSNPSRFQEDNLFAHFGIQKRSPKRSPPGPRAKNTFKNWLKMNFELFQSTQNNRSGGSVLGSVFSYSKSMECQLSLEKKFKVIAILEHFLGLFEIGLLSNLIFRDSELHFGAPKMSCLAVFWKFLRRHFKNKYKMMYLSYWFDFLFQEKFRVCFFEFQSLSKNGAQNGAHLLFKFSN